MGKNAVKSTVLAVKSLSKSGALVSDMVPGIGHNSADFEAETVRQNGYLVPNWQNGVKRAYLDGNLARRKFPVGPVEYSIWDISLAGFGMRVRASGKRIWFVRLRQRGRHRRISLGRCDLVEAGVARAQARCLLAEVALDGLPKPVGVKAAPVFADFVDEFWTDCAHYWKASTQKRSRALIRNDLLPCFGEVRLDEIARGHIVRWRDACAGTRESSFNRGAPILSAMLKYAEQLGYRRKGSNPCRGLTRFKTEPKERYLSQQEYRRLGAALKSADAEFPAYVAAIRLLIYTGARKSEICDLEWQWVTPSRLMLPDSKTGAKVIWLNSQAQAIINGLPRFADCPFLFPNLSLSAPINVDPWWRILRKRCALPDVRIHDLRHSFASSALMDNVPLATIGKLLGHALPETTAKYAHLADDVIADAATRISASLARAIGLCT